MTNQENESASNEKKQTFVESLELPKLASGIVHARVAAIGAVAETLSKVAEAFGSAIQPSQKASIGDTVSNVRKGREEALKVAIKGLTEVPGRANKAFSQHLQSK